MSKLAHQHVVRRLAVESETGSTDPALVGQGMMKLYSFYEPSLVGADYWIDSFQQISVVTDPKQPAQTKSVFNYNSVPTPPTDPTNAVRQMQTFEVVAPQFSIPLDDITAHYPPDGHQDEGRVLPHIVFNDPHLPWERYPGKADPFIGPSTDKRESVPWLAVIVFDPEDLLLSADEITALGVPTVPIISTDLTAKASPTKVPPGGAYPMSVQQYLSMNRFCRVEYDVDSNWNVDAKGNPLPDSIQMSQEGMTAIFPTKDMFNTLFGTKDLLEQNKSLAHVRNINTTGMPDAGVEETGLFSIIISRRTGPVTLSTPKTQMAHLISIEHFDSTLDRIDSTDPKDKDTSGIDRIGLVSLFSWTYTALPPNPVNFLDSMIAIGNSTQLLKPDQSILDSVKKVSTKLANRLGSGYVFSRWRAQTGEETVAFNRGPLVPAPVTSPATDKTKTSWPSSSNYGTDYQILDKDLGVMDISYSSAWQLGKTLAIGDRVFAAALMRFRGLVYTKAASETRTAVSTMNSAGDLLGSLSAHIDNLVSLSTSGTRNPVGAAPPQTKVTTPSVNDPAVQPTFQDNLRKNALNQMYSQDFTAPSGVGTALYNGFNNPLNSDWAVILNWITSKLYLDGIPAQYLIVDPSHLPMERLRFFHIDPNWLDCLIDGALSACNHADRGDDVIRKAIKDGYNLYLQQMLPTTTHTPQIPQFGFILRSAVVKAFPGLHIDIPFPAGTDLKKETRATICHFTAINDTTLMCLLDRLPEELESITLTQPPHQQRFSLGESITVTQPPNQQSPPLGNVEFELLQLTTDSNFIPKGEWPRIDPPVHSSTLWDPVSRCFDVKVLKQIISDGMAQLPPPAPTSHYDDSIVTSLPIALQLNDPCYYLRYHNLNSHYTAQEMRQLWSGSSNTGTNLDGNSSSGTLPSASPNLPIAKNPPSQPASSPVPSLIPPHIQTGISTSPNLLGDGPAVSGTPHIQYTCAVYPDYLLYPKLDHPDYTIPTHNTYLMDLVFSVKRTNLPSVNDRYFLSSIAFDIPLSVDKPTAKDPEPLLKYPYSGPGPRMLSNLRFTVSLNRVGNILQCVLVPRGMTAITMLDRRLMDLSFKLSQCEIAEIVQNGGKGGNVPYPRGSGKTGVVPNLGTVNINYREGYCFAPDGQVTYATSAAPVVVYKKNGGDDSF